MKLVLDGDEFPFPENLDMREQRLIKKYSGQPLAYLKEEAARSDPDVMAAFCHIVIGRQNPQVTDREVEERVNKIKKVDVIVEESDAELPPAMTPTENAPGSENVTSGPSSSNGSDGSPVTIPVSTGTPL